MDTTEIRVGDYVRTLKKQGPHAAGLGGYVLVVTDATGMAGGRGTPALVDIEAETGSRMFVPIDDVVVLTAKEVATYIDDINQRGTA
tara:strand:- start:3992 stop:4252 length:261 start_codon:yes stop_codon:yes gene_type:complete